MMLLVRIATLASSSSARGRATARQPPPAGDIWSLFPLYIRQCRSGLTWSSVNHQGRASFHSIGSFTLVSSSWHCEALLMPLLDGPRLGWQGWLRRGTAELNRAQLEESPSPFSVAT